MARRVTTPGAAVRSPGPALLFAVDRRITGADNGYVGVRDRRASIPLPSAGQLLFCSAGVNQTPRFELRFYAEIAGNLEKPSRHCAARAALMLPAPPRRCRIKGPILRRPLQTPK